MQAVFLVILFSSFDCGSTYFCQIHVCAQFSMTMNQLELLDSKATQLYSHETLCNNPDLVNEMFYLIEY